MTPNDPGWIFRPITFVERVKPLHDRLVTRPYHVICRRSSVFRKIIFLTPVTPNDPGWIFRPISFVAIHPYLLLTKFGKNPIKHVEEEADCEKERRKKKELDTFAITDGVPCRRKWSQVDLEPLNAIESLKLMHIYEQHRYTVLHRDNTMYSVAEVAFLLKIAF